MVALPVAEMDSVPGPKYSTMEPVRTGTCSVPEELPALFPLVQSGRLKPEKYISHRLPLSQGAEAYKLFEARKAGALKMVLVPD